MIYNCNPILLLPFLILEIIDIDDPSQEMTLHLEFDVIKIQHCSFNLEGELIFSCKIFSIFSIIKIINIVCVYSIQSNNKSKCQKIFKIPEGADVINISKYNKVLLRSDDEIYEWDIRTGHTTTITKNIHEVMNVFVTFHSLEIVN